MSRGPACRRPCEVAVAVAGSGAPFRSAADSPRGPPLRESSGVPIPMARPQLVSPLGLPRLGQGISGSAALLGFLGPSGGPRWPWQLQLATRLGVCFWHQAARRRPAPSSASSKPLRCLGHPGTRPRPSQADSPRRAFKPPQCTPLLPESAGLSLPGPAQTGCQGVAPRANGHSRPQQASPFSGEPFLKVRTTLKVRRHRGTWQGYL